MPGGGSDFLFSGGDLYDWESDSGTGRHDPDIERLLTKRQFSSLNNLKSEKFAQDILDIRDGLGAESLEMILEVLLYWNRHADEFAGEMPERLQQVIKDFPILHLMWFDNRHNW